MHCAAFLSNRLRFAGLKSPSSVLKLLQNLTSNRMMGLQLRSQPVIIIRHLAALEAKEMTMIDTSRKGRRCRATKMVRTHEAKIEPERRGTIVHEIENLGRRMVLVEWDDNSSLYVFPDEIEIEES